MTSLPTTFARSLVIAAAFLCLGGGIRADFTGTPGPNGVGRNFYPAPTNDFRGYLDSLEAVHLQNPEHFPASETHPYNIFLSMGVYSDFTNSTMVLKPYHNLYIADGVTTATFGVTRENLDVPAGVAQIAGVLAAQRNTTVKGIYFSPATTTSSRIAIAGENISISDNYFENGVRGLTGVMDGSLSGVSVTNNVFRNHTGYSLDLSDTAGIKIRDNIFVRQNPIDGNGRSMRAFGTGVGFDLGDVQGNDDPGNNRFMVNPTASQSSSEIRRSSHIPVYIGVATGTASPGEGNAWEDIFGNELNSEEEILSTIVDLGTGGPLSSPQSSRRNTEGISVVPWLYNGSLSWGSASSAAPTWLHYE